MSTSPNCPNTAPKLTKTAENPRMNANAPNKVRPRPVRVSRCPADPPRNARYPGNSGKTHGEMNDTRPAAKARGNAARSDAGSVAIIVTPTTSRSAR